MSVCIVNKLALHTGSLPSRKNDPWVLENKTRILYLVAKIYAALVLAILIFWLLLQYLK